MEDLLIESQQRVNNTPNYFKRYLLDKVNWNNRLIAIKGARGVGKTTLILQYIAQRLPQDHTVLYISLDHLYFYSHNLIDLADEFVKNSGRYLFLDEIHKYSNWSRELKLIYDKYPGLQVVFTSSSILEIYKGESDLSRRLVSYNLNELSFREFIELESKIKLPSFSLKEILNNHTDISSEILAKLKPLFEFKKYLKHGAYPYFIEGIDEYDEKMINTINLILETDLPAVHKIDYALIGKIKKLLYAVSTSVPFKPNISKLSERTGVTRPTLLLFLNYLEKSLLIKQLRTENIGISIMSKPEKLYLHNTNLIFSIAKENANTGNVRETFFINQISNDHRVNYSKIADFFIDNKYIFEVGGKSKSQKQIKNIPNAYVIKDDIESGIKNIIPLWLFGFLY